MEIGCFKNYPHRAYGITFEKRHITGMLKIGWILMIYYGRRYRCFSNYQLTKE